MTGDVHSLITFVALLVWGVIAIGICGILLPIAWKILADRAFAGEEINRALDQRTRPTLTKRIIFASLTASAPLAIAAMWGSALLKTFQ